MKKNNSNLDKMIKANFKMIDNHLAGACGLITLTLVFIWIAIIFGVILLAVIGGIGFLCYKIYYILFYDSLFGKRAVFYGSLPVTSEEAVLSRLYVAFMSVLIIEGFAILGLLILGAFWSVDGDFIKSLLEVLAETVKLEGNTSIMLPFAVVLLSLSSLVVINANFSVILWAICYYQSLPLGKKKSILKVVLTVAAGLFYLLGTSVIPMTMGFIGLDSYVLQTLVNMIAMISILVFTVRKTVSLLDGGLKGA